MHSKLFLGAAAFFAVASASISIDVSEAHRVASDVLAYVSSVTANPAFKSDISAIASAVPSSVIAAAEQDPEKFAEAIITATALPSWVSAIPTSALGSLETLGAKPAKAVEDVGSYVESLVQEPFWPSVNSVLATAVPSSVEAQLEADPVSFFEAQVTATTPPAYITALPKDIQSGLGSFINGAMSVVASDFEASSVAPIKPTLTKSAVSTGTGVVAYNGTTSSPLAFTGAASSVNVNTIGAGVIAAFGIVLALL